MNLYDRVKYMDPLKRKNIVHKFLRNVSDIFLPRLCLGCKIPIHPTENILCIFCRYELPLTQSLQSLEENEIHQRSDAFIKYAYGYFYYDKTELPRSLLYNFKYKGLTKIGVYLGQVMALHIQKSKLQSCDGLLPVPLHRKRLRKRGFNQSEILAKSIGAILGIPVISGAVTRLRHTKSQTKGPLSKRVSNTTNTFSYTLGSLDRYRHIIIVDDIITTGSTLDGVYTAIAKDASCMVSYICLGVTR